MCENFKLFLKFYRYLKKKLQLMRIFLMSIFNEKILKVCTLPSVETMNVFPKKIPKKSKDQITMRIKLKMLISWHLSD